MIEAHQFVEAARERGFRWYAGVPCSFLTPFINYVLQDPALEYYHWRMTIVPKLAKAAGFEWGTGFYINPTPPEEAARFLREAGLG